MGKKIIFLIVLASAVMLALLTMPRSKAESAALTPLQKLGKMLFFDTNLSQPKGQSCAACHGSDVGFTGPNVVVNGTGGVYPGAVPSRYGNRKPPASSYAGSSPRLNFNKKDETWVGGMFWDGRAAGNILGDPLAEQAEGPFLNPMEQNLPSAKVLCQRVRDATYAPLFKQVWVKVPLNCNTTAQVGEVYAAVGRSIAAYERSYEVSPFTSKYDYYLKGQVKLTAQEKLGLQLFEGKAKCASCHISKPANGKPPMFTDYTYDNLGVPRNPLLPFYYELAANPQGTDYVDPGLGGYLKAAGNDSSVYEPAMGKMKVPTLRNVDKRPNPWFVKAYTHNGYFKSLEEIVHFYNTRDTLPTCKQNDPGVGKTCWPAPEMSKNVNKTELGNMGLSAKEEAAVVSFLKTLTDGYKR